MTIIKKSVLFQLQTKKKKNKKKDQIFHPFETEAYRLHNEK